METHCPACRTPLAPAGRFCHRCGVPVTAERKPGSPRPASVRMMRNLLIAGWVLCLIAWLLLVWVEVETVMATGPAILLTGLLLVIMAWRAQYLPALAIGLAHMGICILFVALVNILRWSPAEAYQPFTLMGTSFLILALPWTLWVWRHLPEVHQPWECAKCGYLLYGLTESRCPECGTPFDPARVAGLGQDLHPSPTGSGETGSKAASR